MIISYACSNSHGATVDLAVGQIFKSGDGPDDREVEIVEMRQYQAKVKILAGPGARRKDPHITVWLKHLSDRSLWTLKET